MSEIGSATPRGQTGQPLLLIQYLRGLAALLVLLQHSRNPRDWLFNPLDDQHLGVVGVDLFFVISGFIMYVAARNEPVAVFVAKRLRRILPLYWLVLSFLILLKLGSGHAVAWPHLVKSYFLVPFANPDHNMMIWPILVPGWTLMYELAFYGLFALGLTIRRPVEFVTVTLLSLVIWGCVVPKSDAVMATYTDPQMLEFLAGLWLGVAYRRGYMDRFTVMLPAGLILFIGCAALDLMSFPWRAAIAITTIAGAIGLQSRGNVPDWRLPRLLGDASYSIYLSHAIVVTYSLDEPLRQLPLEGWPQFIAVVVTKMVIGTLAGIAIYRCLERPLLARLSRRHVSSRDRVVSAAILGETAAAGGGSVRL